MEYINSSLGIPVKAYFDDMKYLNAAGGKRNAWQALSTIGMLQYSLSNSEKKRYRDVMGSPSNPQSSKIVHYTNDILAVQYPFDANMSSEKLTEIIENLTNYYSREDTERDGLAASVAKDNKPFSKDPNRSWIATLQDKRAMMQAINDYRAKVIKAYDKAYAREEKAAEAAASAPTTQISRTTTASTSIGQAQGQAGSGGSVTGPIANVVKGDVKVGGTQVKKSYLLIGGLAVGVLGFLYFKNR